MRCPECNGRSLQTGTLTHRDELGTVQEIFCFCFDCKKDITERITDEWVESRTKQFNQGIEGQGKGFGKEGRGPGRQGG